MVSEGIKKWSMIGCYFDRENGIKYVDVREREFGRVRYKGSKFDGVEGLLCGVRVEGMRKGVYLKERLDGVKKKGVIGGKK